MIVQLLTEHHLEFLSLKGGCRGSSESTNVKIPHCWKSHALAHIILSYGNYASEFDQANIAHVRNTVDLAKDERLVPAGKSK